MENLSQALIMGASVLMFIIAISVAVLTYSGIMRTNSQILTTSEYYDRTAESIATTETYTTYYREYTSAEIAMQILSMYENRDYNFNTIKVDIGSSTFNVFNRPADDVVGGDGALSANFNDINKKIKAIANSNRKYRILEPIDFANESITYVYAS